MEPVKIKGTDGEKVFLEGPRSRIKEFVFGLKILVEFIAGFRALHFLGPCVAVFGSARLTEDSPFYQSARQIG
ncbi:MAG: TIGR00730 family Rossman fold protein, partial [Bacteroidia bacterium]